MMSGSTALTPKQRKILAYIRAHVAEVGMAPTRAEIARAFSCTKNNIQEQVCAMARKGVLCIEPRVARGIRVSACAVREVLS